MLSLVLCAILSISTPQDYKLTDYLFQTNLLQGVGMGTEGAYRKMRFEDVVFINEAYAERVLLSGFIPYITGQIGPIESRQIGITEYGGVFDAFGTSAFLIGFKDGYWSNMCGPCRDDLTINDAVYETDGNYKINGSNVWDLVYSDEKFRKSGDEKFLFWEDILGTNATGRAAPKKNIVQSMYKNVKNMTAGFWVEVETGNWPFEAFYAGTYASNFNSYKPLGEKEITYTYTDEDGDVHDYTTYVPYYLQVTPKPVQEEGGEHKTEATWKYCSLSWVVTKYEYYQSEPQSYSYGQERTYKNVKIGQFVDHDKGEYFDHTGSAPTFLRLKGAYGSNVYTCYETGTEFDGNSFDLYLMASGVAKVTERAGTNTIVHLNKNFVCINKAGPGAIDTQTRGITFVSTSLAKDVFMPVINHFNIRSYVESQPSIINPDPPPEITTKVVSGIFSKTHSFTCVVTLTRMEYIVVIKPKKFHAEFTEFTE